MGEAVKTRWEGLWNDRAGVYSSKTIRKADIPSFSKLIVRYSKFYEKGSNRPRFVYCFAKGDAADAITLEVDKQEYMTLSDAEKLSEMRCFSDYDLQRLINLVAVAAGGASEYGEHIISDFVDGYGTETEVIP